MKKLNILSLGGGVQSSVIFHMALRDEFPEKLDCAIFADTGFEPKAVYENMETLVALGKENGIPVYVVQLGNIREDTIARSRGESNRVAMIPWYVFGKDGKPSTIIRQCTSDYKINMIEKKTRELLGLQPRQRWKEENGFVNMWIGISTDEAHRMKDGRKKYIDNVYPLIDWRRMSRIGCYEYAAKIGIEEPPKSACICCPFHNNRAWDEMKQKRPDEFQQAVDFEREIQKQGLPNLKGMPFLHRSLVPLDQVSFIDKSQPSLFGEECEGVCGV